MVAEELWAQALTMALAGLAHGPGCRLHWSISSPCPVGHVDVRPYLSTLKLAEAGSCRKMLNLTAVYSHNFLWPGQQLGGRVETVQSFY